MNDSVLDKLIAGCRQGERKAQKKLYELFAPKMYAVCLRYAGSPEDAQDILQNGFIKMFRKLNDFRGEGSFEGWLRRIMVTTSIEQYRKTASMQPLQTIDEHLSERLSDQQTVLDRIHAEELLKLIERLSPGYRAVLNMHLIEGFSHKEIASMLGITEGTSKSQLARARNILRQMIAGREDHNYATTAG
ncbi:RNA polymerase sigma factor [Anseongella ginsenosidimutans]|uniref:RNA polymerase sigma factor n=1 Tax=Anseongella ginsenosidimutans TaxID=496056 RepID=UPI001CEF6018|nr:sigma-70 family RNA polymerase sigma factor [Anseongella ginsenosidimutans]